MGDARDKNCKVQRCRQPKDTTFHLRSSPFPKHFLGRPGVDVERDWAASVLRVQCARCPIQSHRASLLRHHEASEPRSFYSMWVNTELVLIGYSVTAYKSIIKHWSIWKLGLYKTTCVFVKLCKLCISIFSIWLIAKINNTPTRGELLSHTFTYIQLPTVTHKAKEHPSSALVHIVVGGHYINAVYCNFLLAGRWQQV